MKTVNLRRYSEPQTLREISPRTLVALLDEHRDFLAGKGIELPPVGEEKEIDYELLAPVFQSPDDIPEDLVERFHMVKEMSGSAQMDRILDTVRQRQIDLSFVGDSSPEDVAAHLLLTHPPLFHELYAERAVARFRAFTYYVARKRRSNFQPPSNLSPLERTLNGWYEAHQRGRSARVFWRAHRNEYWFNVRHAEPIKRDGCVDLKDFESGSTIYRPERHDLVIYDTEAGELRVHADGDREREMFRLVFGLHLFGDGSYFPASREKFTLEPLRSGGRKALTCAGIDGLLGVRLTEIQYRDPVVLGVKETVAAPDVFSVFEARQFQIPAKADIRLARFAVQFCDARKPRTFILRPSNYANFSRDDDAVPLKGWLHRQNFALTNGKEDLTNEPWTLECA